MIFKFLIALCYICVTLSVCLQTVSESQQTEDNRNKIGDEAYKKAEAGGTSSGGYCAQAVREATEKALGETMTRHASAKDYGPSYEEIGFRVEKTYGEDEDVVESDLKKGDVLIFDPVDKHEHGHMEVYTGRDGEGKYSSDFKQKTPYPYSPHAEIKVYRLYDKKNW